jgi:gluconolactonase
MASETSVHRRRASCLLTLADTFPDKLSPNGIGLSPDQKTLYEAETITSRLWAFEVTGPGTLSPKGMPGRGGKMLFAPHCWSLFDSLAVEACGNIAIAIATLDRGGITVVSPRGKALDFVPMPDEDTTNICFGGADLRVAWITLSFSGQLVKLDWPREGLALNF